MTINKLFMLESLPAWLKGNGSKLLHNESVTASYLHLIAVLVLPPLAGMTRVAKPVIRFHFAFTQANFV